MTKHDEDQGAAATLLYNSRELDNVAGTLERLSTRDRHDPEALDTIAGVVRRIAKDLKNQARGRQPASTAP
jgi:hypothetical protein